MTLLTVIKLISPHGNVKHMASQLSASRFPHLNSFKCILFHKEPSPRPSSKTSLFLDLEWSNCTTKSSLAVP